MIASYRLPKISCRTAPPLHSWASARILGIQAACALLIVCVQSSRAPAQAEYTAEQMEGWVFQQDGNAAGARKRLDSYLTVHIDEIDLACKLTGEQKMRLQLAGRGDIKRFFDRFESLRRSFKPIRQDQPDFQEVWQKFWMSISPLQASLQNGLFEADSLFGKIALATLTPTQRESYDSVLNQRRQFQYRSSIALAVLTLDKTARLTQAQRRQLTEFFTKETKAPKKSGPYDFYYLLWQLSQLPEEKLRVLFDDVQRKAIDSQLQQARNMAQSFRGNKIWPGNEDDENDDKPPEHKPADAKKQ
jgi:hypothetical protein